MKKELKMDCLQEKRKMENKFKIQNMKTEELAKWLHDNYEDLTKKNKWDTQKSCKVEFEDLPDENKKVMLSMVRRIHKRI